MLPASVIAGSALVNLTYHHPWFDNQTCPLVHADHVTMEKGTGLVHTAPAHGQDDFVLALKHGLEMVNSSNSKLCLPNFFDLHAFLFCSGLLRGQLWLLH